LADAFFVFFGAVLALAVTRRAAGFVLLLLATLALRLRVAVLVACRRVRPGRVFVRFAMNNILWGTLTVSR